MVAAAAVLLCCWLLCLPGYSPRLNNCDSTETIEVCRDTALRRGRHDGSASNNLAVRPPDVKAAQVQDASGSKYDSPLL
jgi:hypothetical protein